MFGKPKGLAFQNVKFLLYIKVVGVFQKGQSKEIYRVSSFPSFRHFFDDRANTPSVRRNGGKVLLSTIRQPFYHGRQTPWESQSTNGEDEFVLRKL